MRPTPYTDRRRGGHPIQRTIAVNKRLEQIGRTIPVQHRKIRELLATVLASARSDDAQQARTALDLLRPALEAHFELEERRLFPLLRDAHPELEQRFAALCAEHRRILDDLSGLPRRLSGGAAQAFSQLIADHEEREEDLVRLAQT